MQERTLKNYFAFTKLKNFACIEIKPTARKILLYLKVDPDAVDLLSGFTRDVGDIDHYGTGNLEVTLSISGTWNAQSPFFHKVMRHPNKGDKMLMATTK